MKAGQGGVHDAPRRDDLFIVSPSHWSKAGFEEAGFYVERIHVVSHGVDPDGSHPIDPSERAAARKALRIEGDDFELLGLGAITQNKGIDLFLIAYAILRQRYRHLKLALKDQSALYERKPSHASAFFMAAVHSSTVAGDGLVVARSLWATKRYSPFLRRSWLSVHKPLAGCIEHMRGASA